VSAELVTPPLTAAPPAGALRAHYARLVAAWRTGEDIVGSWEAFDMAAASSLLLLLLYGGDFWYLKIPTTILCLIGVLHPPFRHSVEFWVAASTALVVANARNWYLVDNHKYLITYWCIALALAAGQAERSAILRRSARWLIGLPFAFAMLWKLVSQDYSDGTFFHHALLLDGRFGVVARLSGLGAEALTANTAAERSLLAFDSTLTTVALQTTPAVAAMARFLTAWTLAIEFAITLLFLWPEDRGPSRLRDAALLLFLVSTYGIAPVIGFGWVLAIMGAVQARSGRARAAYVACFIVLQVYRVPWKLLFA
jgi:hypothetical protein